MVKFIEIMNTLKLIDGEIHRNHEYTKTSNIRHSLVGNKIVDHSDVVGASPIAAAPTTSSFSTWLQWIGQRQLWDETRNILDFFFI